MPPSLASLTTRFTVLRANPVDRAIARILSPASHRRITCSMSIILTSRYAIYRSSHGLEWHTYAENRNWRWVNDPENGGSKFLKTGGSMILKIYGPDGSMFVINHTKPSNRCFTAYAERSAILFP